MLYFVLIHTHTQAVKAGLPLVATRRSA